MYKRLYVIPLKPNLPRDTVNTFIGVLKDAPNHIPGMTWSTVALERSPNRCELAWDHAFDSVESYEAYRLHPYHCNVIDQYMYRESPESVIEASATVYSWLDDVPISADDVLRVPPEPAPVQASRIDTSDGEPDIFLLEQIELRPGTLPEYVRAVRDQYLPEANSRGMTLLMSLQTPEATGEANLTLLWRIAGWTAWARIRREFHRGGLNEWMETVGPMQVGGRRRLLLKADLGPEWGE